MTRYNLLVLPCSFNGLGCQRNEDGYAQRTFRFSPSTRAIIASMLSIACAESSEPASASLANFATPVCTGPISRSICFCDVRNILR